MTSTSLHYHYRRQLPSYLGWTIALAAIISLLRVFLSPITISIIADEFTLRPSGFGGDSACMSNDKYYDPHRVLCFVTASYASDSRDLDEITNVTQLRLDNPSFRFVLFTNLDDIDAPGWTPIITHLPYRRFITHSRYGKFVGWKEPLLVDMCSVVFYMDAHRSPVQYPSYWNKVSHQILHSQDGLMQVLHKTHKKAAATNEDSDNSLVLNEYQRILSKSKDIPSNLNKQVKWLKSQPDFDPVNTNLYFNGHFGYDPKNERFRLVSEAFWSRYSQEIDSWRDQPLWAYFIHKYSIKPLILPANTTEADDVFLKTGKVGHGGHEYTKDADSDALLWYSTNRGGDSNADYQKQSLSSLPITSSTTTPSIQEQFECSTPKQGSITDTHQDNTMDKITSTNQLGCIFQRLQQHDAIHPGSLVYVIHRSYTGDGTTTSNTTIRITTSPPPTESSSVPSSLLQAKNDDNDETLTSHQGKQKQDKEVIVFDDVVVADRIELPSQKIISGMTYYDFELVSFEKKYDEIRGVDNYDVVNDENGENKNVASPRKGAQADGYGIDDSVIIHSTYRRMPRQTPR